jgi:hypothetical protein
VTAPTSSQLLAATAAPTSRGRCRAPVEWHFSDEAWNAHRSSFWACPTSVVRLGMWATLWRYEGTKRGGGTMSSILPVLALGTFPGKRAFAEFDLPANEPLWTPWQYLSYRRIARLSGIHQESIGRALETLVESGVLQRHAVRPRFSGGPKRWFYRLTVALYATGRGTFFRFPAAMVYGGMWAYLPTRGARHLFVAIAGLDAVLDEDAYRARIEEDGEIDAEDEDPVIRQRSRHPMSLGRLSTATGMTRNAVDESLRLLQTPLVASTGLGAPDLSLISSGPAQPGTSRWFSPNMAIAGLRWPPALLNDRAALGRDRLARYPMLACRRRGSTNLRIL